MNSCSYIHISMASRPDPAILEEPDTCDSTHDPDSGALAAVGAKLLRPGVVRAVADVFRLLGDPTRVRLVDALFHGERCVCDLAALVGLTESAVSHQLRLLRAARLVRVRRARGPADLSPCAP